MDNEYMNNYLNENKVSNKNENVNNTNDCSINLDSNKYVNNNLQQITNI